MTLIESKAKKAGIYNYVNKFPSALSLGYLIGKGFVCLFLRLSATALLAPVVCGADLYSSAQRTL